MRVKEMLNQMNGILWTNEATGENVFVDIYAGDLLSNVMGHAQSGQLFLTIMNNMNVIAVASLLDLPCVVFAEGVEPTPAMIARANDENIALVTSALSTVAIIRKLSE